ASVTPGSAVRHGAPQLRTPSRSFPALLDELRHEPRPSRLVAGADPGAGIAVEVLVEEDQVAPVRIGLEFVLHTVHGALAIRVAEEDARQAPRDLGGDVPQGQHLAGARRVF